MCGGFTCSKNALTALNILYVLVACILMGVAGYCHWSTRVANLPIINGILACGVILILISVLGIVAAVKHHQVLLFFRIKYMLILFILFLVQFSVACACLAVNKEQQHQLAEQGWKKFTVEAKDAVQKEFTCCGFEQDLHHTGQADTPDGNPQCPMQATRPCMDKLQSNMDYAFKLTGGIGLFFSFTEMIAVAVAFRYRNQVNPDKNKLTSGIIPSLRHRRYV